MYKCTIRNFVFFYRIRFRLHVYFSVYINVWQWSPSKVCHKKLFKDVYKRHLTVTLREKIPVYKKRNDKIDKKHLLNKNIY